MPATTEGPPTGAGDSSSRSDSSSSDSPLIGELDSGGPLIGGLDSGSPLIGGLDSGSVQDDSNSTNRLLVDASVH